MAIRTSKSSSQPSPQRQVVLTFATPSVADILFYETVDGQRIGTAVPDYGTPHPDSRRWPNHKLIFIQNDDDTGQLLRYYYAADRDAQDAYNYELNAGLELTRTYVIPRADYPTRLPVPAGGTADSAFTSYGFVSDSIADVGQPLNGLYIAVQRKFEPITRTERLYDPVTESDKSVTTTLKPVGYVLNTNPTPPALPEISGNGTVYEVKYVNQFHSILIKSDAGVGYPLQRKAVLNFVSPSIADILFYETVSSATAIPGTGYGSSHPNETLWPYHKLVYIDNEESGKGHLQRRYYAAERVSQDAYNYELVDGISLTRTYVIRRDSYDKTPVIPGSTNSPGTLTVPAGGTPDSVFDDYGFVSDSIVDVGQPLNGLYIAVQRKFEPIVKTDTQYDQTLESNVTTTATLKPYGYQLAVSEVSGAGVTYEVKYVNNFHSLLVTTKIDFTFPPATPYKAMDTVYSMTMYKLPSILTAFTVHTVYAFSSSSVDYTESVDFMATPTLVELSDGPYRVRTLRYITPTPDSVVTLIAGNATYKRLPVPHEDLVVAALYGAWWVSGTGAATAIANVREFPVPRALLATSTVTKEGPALNPNNYFIKENLTAQVTATNGEYLKGDWLIDVTTKEVALNLYEVSASILTV